MVNEKASTNGVIYEVSDQELKETDNREKGYVRTKINPDSVIDFSNKIDTKSNIWIYADVFKSEEEFKSKLPSVDFPIVQSYADICINGCIEIEKLYPLAREHGYAVDFIKSTQYWSKFWVNDRIYPRRPFIHRPTAYQIDKLLKDNLEDKSLFNKIYFE